ncbi:MAG: HTTM domain-containing protein [Pseudomonadota bacterium]
MNRRLSRLAMFLRDRWFSIDLRTLGLFRIVFGLRLLIGLMQDTWDGNLVAFFSNDGVLSNHFALFAPIQPRAWSLLFAVSSPAEVAVAFLAIAAVYVLYTIGWKTRLMQILVIVCFISVVNRNLLLQDGGSFVTTVLAVWTAFLPLGARFSLDSRLARQEMGAAPPPVAGRAERYVSFACFAVLLQIAVIYLFNAANKYGPSWSSGTAVHYVLWQNRMNTFFAGILRLHEPGWFSPVMSRATLIFEWTAPALILTPILQTWTRRVLIAGMWSFHLGIAMILSLGAFSYVMMIGGLLLLGGRDWDLLERLAARCQRSWRRRTGRRDVAEASDGGPWNLLGAATGTPPPARTAPPEQPRPIVSLKRRGARIAREGVAIVLFAAMLSELTLANPCVPPRLQMQSRPEWMAAMLHYLRVYQAWGMFSPDAPGQDGIVVVDATLADGSHVDPLTNRPPDFDALAHGPWYLGHHWSEYMSYYPWERHRRYRDGLLHHVLRRYARGQPPADKSIRSVEIVWLSAQSPPPGKTAPENIRRETLISYVVPPG